MFKSALPVLLFIFATYAQAIVRVHMEQLPNETIRVIVTNPSERDIKLLKHPNNILETDPSTPKFNFDSVDNLELPASKGFMAPYGPKYTTKMNETYVTVPARSSIHFDHDLLKSYTFPQSDKTRKFTISLAHSSFVTPDNHITFPTPSLTITMSEYGYHSNLLQPTPRPIRTAPYKYCSESDSAAIDHWAWRVQQWSSEARDELSGDIYDHPDHYKMWFGNDLGWSYQVHKTYTYLSAITLQTFVCIDCEHMYDDPYDMRMLLLDYGDERVPIGVCNTLWDKLGDESAEDPIRRMAHAAVTSRKIGFAQEYAHGTAECLKYAKDHPDKAYLNADSLAYFIYD